VADLWTLSSATASLRRRLSDGLDDKYVHQMEVDPEPDGVQTTFAVPDSRLVPGTLEATLDGVPLTPDSVDVDAGRFTLAAPDANQKLRASYYFQWFTEVELEDFLGQATNVVGYDGVTDAGLPLGLRPATLSYACYFACMKKAAEAADSVSASAGGFATDTNRQHPNWLATARLYWDNAVREEESYGDRTPVGTEKPAMAFVTYKMFRYVPRT
jgi:hypothetical protein